MIALVTGRESRLFEVLFGLTQSISGHSDLQTLCVALAQSLRPVVDVDYLALVLYDRDGDVLRLNAITGASVGVESSVSPVSENTSPFGWVWQNQQSLCIPDLAQETRWAPFLSRIRGLMPQSLMILPLTNGNHRLGVLAFGKQDPYEPCGTETAFLQRVASESAVSLDAHLMHEEVTRQRDRLQALFDITNVLVSKLAFDQLFSSISSELAKVIDYDLAVIALLNKASGKLELKALRFDRGAGFDVPMEPVDPGDLPSGEALRTGKPFVYDEAESRRFASPVTQPWLDAGVKSGCTVLLKTSNGPIGTLDLARLTDRTFTREEIELAVQVARQVAIAVENALAYSELAALKDKLATEKLYLEDEIRTDLNLTDMVGESLAFRASLKSAQIVAPTDATVLILGETGTGKELIARAIHEMSERKNQTFVKVNCPAIPATLLESELFGHERGAFTGALTQKIGRFELADRGTLFLDEVGEIPLELQSKLLRAIQEQELERLGSNRTIHVDIRVIAATNRNLKAMVDEGRFRSDLYYRLHVFPLEVPPLRDRKPDIPLLFRYFVQKFASRMNRQIDSIPTSVIDTLCAYNWPGNIRELQNLAERSVILTEGPVLQVPSLENRPQGAVLPVRGAGLNTPQERATILKALREAKGVVGGPNGAAARLGLKRTTLQSRMKRLKIGREYC